MVRGWRSKYKYREAWQIDYTTLSQTHQGKRYVGANNRRLETYPVPHATAWNTTLGLGKHTSWWHSTPERTELGSETYFKNNHLDNWVKGCGIEWVCHISYHAPTSGKTEWYNGLLKSSLKEMGGWTFKTWDKCLGFGVVSVVLVVGAGAASAVPIWSFTKRAPSSPNLARPLAKAAPISASANKHI